MPNIVPAPSMSNKTHQLEINEVNLLKNYGPKSTFAQVFATIAQSFLLVGLGMELTIPMILIQHLYTDSRGELFSLTTTQVSWFGSILLLFHPTGSILSGFLQERFGRKRCMIFANMPSIIGWILLYYTKSADLLFASTVMMGLSIGFSEAPILSYVGEIAEPRLRGKMASVTCTAAMVGSLMICVLGYFFHWRTVALLATLCPITCICLVTLIPESPVWLIAKGQHDKAEKALCWLRGWVEPDVVKTELLEYIRYNQLSGTLHGKINTKNETSFSKLAQLMDRSVYRPLTLVMIVFFISYIICLLPCKPFFTKIMTEVGIKNEDQSLLLVVFAALQNVASIILIFSINYLGKRVVNIMSVLINTVLIISFGLYVVVMKNDYISSTPWIPIVILSGICFFGTPISTLPWMLISEIFPNKSRGIAAGTTGALSYLLMFILTNSYLSIEVTLTLQYTMILFGGIGIFGFAFIYVYLPETENKTLLEIENFFE